MLNYIRNMQQKRNEGGASAVEYGLLVAAIAALIVLIVFFLGGIVKETFQDTCDEISSKAENMSSKCAP